MVICCFMMISIWYYREEPPIKKSSPLFCILILTGVFLCLGSIITLSVYLTTFICNLSIWLIVIGLGLILGSILAKTYRIFRIFSNIRVNASVIRDRDLLVFSFVIILILSIFLAIITISNSDVPKFVYSTNDNLVSYYVCLIFDNLLAQIALYAIIVFFALLFLLLAIVAYLTRNVDSAFNESTYIATTIYAYLAILFIEVPLIIVTDNRKHTATLRYYEITIGILLAMIITIAILFLPKFYFIYKNRRFSFSDENIQPDLFDDDDSLSLSSIITEICSDNDTESFITQEALESLFLSSYLWEGLDN